MSRAAGAEGVGFRLFYLLICGDMHEQPTAGATALYIEGRVAESRIRCGPSCEISVFIETKKASFACARLSISCLSGSAPS